MFDMASTNASTSNKNMRMKSSNVNVFHIVEFILDFLGIKRIIEISF